ncbi:MAPEG family protein [Bordetella trematum]|uniref:MAPEG family protein n=1 Tax=Bordetella trematum TaxID=123899 RepID=UPI003AF3BAA8
MTHIAWLMVVAALLPLVASLASKIAGKGFDNREPRAWLGNQRGWRARADAAQANSFEALPFFYAAVLFALYRQAPAAHLGVLMGAWVVVRLVYLALYVGGYGTLRSLCWITAFVLNVMILFAGR